VSEIQERCVQVVGLLHRMLQVLVSRDGWMIRSDTIQISDPQALSLSSPPCASSSAVIIMAGFHMASLAKDPAATAHGQRDASVCNGVTRTYCTLFAS
jgi:hypothetical protein